MRGKQTNFLNKFSGPESQESRNVSNGVEHTSFQFFKTDNGVSQKIRNISMRGQTYKLLKQVFRSGKSRKSKLIKWGRTNKFSIFQKLSVE